MCALHRSKYNEFAEGQGTQCFNLRVVNLLATQYIVTMVMIGSVDLNHVLHNHELA